MPLGCVPAAAAQQREPVLQAAPDLGDRHHPHLGRGQLDRERQPVEPVDQRRAPRRGRAATPGAGRGRALAEQLDGVVQAELGQLVDPLGGDARAARGSW